MRALRRTLIAVALLAVALGGAHPRPARAGGRVDVDVHNFAFTNPGNKPTLVIDKGTTVRWTASQGDHSATSDGASFDSDVIAQDWSPHFYEYTFTQAGRYTYHCMFHGNKKGMVGTVEVRGDPGETTTSEPPTTSSTWAPETTTTTLPPTTATIAAPTSTTAAPTTATTAAAPAGVPAASTAPAATTTGAAPVAAARPRPPVAPSVGKAAPAVPPTAPAVPPNTPTPSVAAAPAPVPVPAEPTISSVTTSTSVATAQVRPAVLAGSIRSDHGNGSSKGVLAAVAAAVVAALALAGFMWRRPPSSAKG